MSYKENNKYLMVIKRKQDEIKLRYCKDTPIKVLMGLNFVINTLRIFLDLGYKYDL